MNIDKELRQINEIGSAAWEQTMQGNFRAASSLLKRIKHSWCIVESEQAVAVVEAKILESKGDLAGAKARVLRSIGYLWGTPQALNIIAASNPKVDAESAHFYIEILGGLATIGAFTQFSEQHIASFDVVANTTDEALQYISEIARFADPSAKLVLTCARSLLEPKAFERRGVIQTYPFRLYEKQ